MPTGFHYHVTLGLFPENPTVRPHGSRTRVSVVTSQAYRIRGQRHVARTTYDSRDLCTVALERKIEAVEIDPTREAYRLERLRRSKLQWRTYCREASTIGDNPTT